MRNTSPSPRIAQILFEFLCLSLLLGLVVILIYVDTVYLKNTVSEGSLTETVHLLVALICFALFAVGARRFAEERGYLTALATLFLLMAIRENDAVLDQIVHGFWKVPAAAVFFIGAVLVARNRHSVQRPLQNHFQSRSFGYLVTGFLLVVIYSRLFGSGVFWQAALGEAYNPALKGIIQESSELLGYVVLLFGAVLSYLGHFNASRSNNSG